MNWGLLAGFGSEFQHGRCEPKIHLCSFFLATQGTFSGMRLRLLNHCAGIVRLASSYAPKDFVRSSNDAFIDALVTKFFHSRRPSGDLLLDHSAVSCCLAQLVRGGEAWYWYPSEVPAYKGSTVSITTGIKCVWSHGIAFPAPDD